MKYLPLAALLLGLAGCGAISQQMEAQGRSCAARGGVLTGMGCEGATAFSSPPPGRIDTAPPTDRYGQPNYNAEGQYVGGHGLGTLVDRPPMEPSIPAAPTPMPSNVVCTRNAAGNAGACTSQ